MRFASPVDEAAWITHPAAREESEPVFFRLRFFRMRCLAKRQKCGTSRAPHETEVSHEQRGWARGVDRRRAGLL